MLYTISNEYLTVTAAEKGAELQSVRDSGGTEYLWQGDPAYWKSRAHNIFPYIARLVEGKYYMDGELHEMPIHGIAPYAQFRLIEKEEDKMALEITDEGCYEQYPRRFALRIRYALQAAELCITYEVENRDERMMYYGIGGHPGFRIPVHEGLAFEDYRLRFPASPGAKRIIFNDDCFVSGREEAYALEEDQYIPLRHDLFDRDAIVLRDVAREVTLETKDGEPVWTVAFPDFTYVGMWHRPKSDAPFVCIEPWSSLPSAAGGITVFEEKEDLLRLAPGNTWSTTWTIRLHNIL